MPQIKRPLTQYGFTLLELLIVIVLLGVMAALIATTIRKPIARQVHDPILQIRTLLDPPASSWKELVCIRHCTECFVSDAHGAIQKSGVHFPPLEAFRFDRRGNTEAYEFGRFKDQAICLRFRYYPNGSTSTMILKSPKGVYFIPSYFGAVRRFATLDDAQSYLQDRQIDLHDSGAYY
ncbi:prepilin-type N-terminal cleavage/methylation domain-containing protein [Nitratifractor sp.]